MVRLRNNRSNLSNYIAQGFMYHYNDGRGIDRISEFPRHLIDDIWSRLSIKDIAQMSVLSKTWNHIWSTFPILVLDSQFREEINYKNQSSSSITFDFKNIVDKILLQHNGPIVKFVLDISSISSDHWDIDHWIRYISMNGIKELRIENSIQSAYNLPSFLFNSGLSDLTITNCDFRTSLASTSFQSLVRLDLTQISFDPVMVFTILEAPLLLTLLLTSCDGLQYLNISASQLHGLHIIDSHNIDFSFLKAYTELKLLTIVSFDKIKEYEFWKRFTLEDIIYSFPKLTRFWFNSTFFKIIVPRVISKRLEVGLENLLELNLGLCFADEAQISAVICLLHSAPHLHSIKIKHELSNVEEIDVDKVREYLTAPNCIKEDLMALLKIKLEGFVNTITERLFMKLMLARCPSLVQVKVTPANSIQQHDDILFFILQVLKFPRASLNVKIELEQLT